LEWKPLSGTCLVAGCKNGICIWNIVTQQVHSGKPGESYYQDQTSWMNYYRYPNHAPVTCVAWSPQGSLLATGSGSPGTAVIIWNTITGVPTRLQGIGNGVLLLKWSPNGDYLFAAEREVFRVWETCTWTCEKWSNFSGYCQSACWRSDSRLLALTIKGETCIHFIQFETVLPKIGGHIVRTESLASYIVTSADQKTVEVKLGEIAELEWDHHGQRLAVSFVNSEVIAVYQTNWKFPNQVIISALGFIRGPLEANKPKMLAFRPHFPRGALLAVCWTNGKISFYPLYFNLSSNAW